MASQDEAVRFITVPANADLSANQFQMVLVNGSGNAAVNTVAGGRVDGVIYNKPSAAGRDTTIAIAGVCKIVAGGTVTIGGFVKSDAAGKVVDSAGAGMVIGKSLSAGVNGQVVRVLLSIPGSAF
jgi:hypothetical protein